MGAIFYHMLNPATESLVKYSPSRYNTVEIKYRLFCGKRKELYLFPDDCFCISEYLFKAIQCIIKIGSRWKMQSNIICIMPGWVTLQKHQK